MKVSQSHKKQLKGTVYSSRGLWYTLKLESGTFVEGRVKGKHKTRDSKLTNPLAVGDRVLVDADPNRGDFQIEEVLPRENYLIRKSPRKTAHFHVIASNLDAAFLVFSLFSPRTSLGFLDRFLVCCEAYHIPAGILFHKADLWEAEDKSKMKEVWDLYHGMNYRTFNTSIEDPLSLKSFEKALEGQSSLVFGHSGAGKSSILNLLHPELALPVQDISKFSDKGKHTTTFATMYDLNDATQVIDTPGIKEFGLDDTIEDYEIGHFFPEFRPFLEECRFHTCLHKHEPGCAVTAAVKEGRIHPSRYRSYLGILEEDDFKSGS